MLIKGFVAISEQMSEEACTHTTRILNITYYCLTYTQIEELVYLVETMCKSHSPMFNSTHVGDHVNAAVVNQWWLFSEHIDENGAKHHTAHNSIYIWAVLLMLLLALAIIIAFCWLCKGPILKGIHKALKGLNSSGDKQQVMELGTQQPGVLQSAIPYQATIQLPMAPQPRAIDTFPRIMPLPDIKYR